MAFHVEAPQLDPLIAFRQLLAHIREPVLLVGRDGIIAVGNVAAAEALATSVAALEGSHLDAYSPAPLGDRLAAAANGRGSFPLRSRDGRRFACDAGELSSELFVVRLAGPEPTQRARAFFETFARLERISVPGEKRGLYEVSRALLTLGIASLGANAAGVFLFDDTGRTLELVGHVGYTPESAERYRLVSLATRIPLTEAIRTESLVCVGTPEEWRAHYPDMIRAQPRFIDGAAAAIPLTIEGRCIGAIGLGYPEPWQFGDADRKVLMELGRHFAPALDSARRHDDDLSGRTALERTASRFERLHAFTGALAQAITPAEVAEAAVDAGMAAVGARSGGLWLRCDDDPAFVTLVRAVGPTGPLPETHERVALARPERMPILDTVQVGAPVWIESCGQLEREYPHTFRQFSRGGESALACIPLLAQGRCIGGLAYNYEGAHQFLEDERAFFQILSWYAAQALERARLYAAEMVARAAAEASHRRSAFLADSDALLATLDYHSTLSAVAAMAVPRIADWCIVELAEDTERGIPPIAAHIDPSKLASVVELSRRVRIQSGGALGLASVISTGKSQLHGRITREQLAAQLRDDELADLFVQSGLVSAMIVPIAARGQTLGAILLNSSLPSRTYDEHDLAMAEELGRKVGLAIENARLYRDVRDADRLKDEFLAMLSHELRNPLVPIVAAVELMGLRDNDTFERERGLIHRNVRHLVRLVDDLLDVSRITRGKIQLRRVRCEVADLIADAVEIAYPAIENREHRLTLSAPGRGMPVLADRVRMAQAIANLLTNAAKYTDHAGSIVVTAAAESGEAVIRVRDNGIGIAPEVLPRVFDLFVQANGTPDRAQGGLGIGLTVVKKLVTLHGGTVSAHSDGLGLGSELVVRLPFAPVEIDDQTSNAAIAISNRAPSRRVLVVEDNPDAANVLSSLLEAVGCTTLVAHDGPTALAAARDFNPDLALLDLGLPVMDGYEVARHLRDLDQSLRIVAVTGYGQDSDRRRTHDAGFEEHIVKPVELSVVRRIVES